jgi:CsoR family transcriptional regulator, copper-sensing transcriptional repressor
MKVEQIDGRTQLRRDAAEKAPILQRLARIEGQVRGLRQMAEADRPTLEQVQQINAVVAALREVALLSISQEVKGQLTDMAASPGKVGDLQGFIELLRSTYRLS